MFEFSVACKYLIPRRRQLSVSIISTVSMLVIALVVWLIVVFFSVKEGLETSWINKLIAMTAPVRVTPTQAYYDSYYYKVDSISAAADYSLRSIGEKRDADGADPYDPNIDEELPHHFPRADLGEDGFVRDLVGEAFDAIGAVAERGGSRLGDLQASDFELTVSNLRLRLLRPSRRGGEEQTTLSQASYLGSFDSTNRSLEQAILPITVEDLSNLLRVSTVGADADDGIAVGVSATTLRRRLHQFFDNVDLRRLSPSGDEWLIPPSLLPERGKWRVAAVVSGGRVKRIVVPHQGQQLDSLVSKIQQPGVDVRKGLLTFSDSGKSLSFANGAITDLQPRVPMTLWGLDSFPAQLVGDSIDTAVVINDISFTATIPVQGYKLHGTVPMTGLTLFDARALRAFSAEPNLSPLWLHNTGGVQTGTTVGVLPRDDTLGDGVLLAKSFRGSGVKLGDRGYISYYAPTTSSVQEQRLPIYVAGFYDPGIVPIGGRFVTVNGEVTSMIRASHNNNEANNSNGINVRFSDVSRADTVKKALEQELAERGVDIYWEVNTYREYEFTRDLIQQLQSEKNLFSLISMIIIIVACSNIVSMLVILVNDKRTEIGILRSMGASSRSIAAIFGICGMTMGLVGSTIGITAAVLTLHNLAPLLSMIGALQGFEVLNATFYGAVIPQELSYRALGFVLVTTAGISLLAGLVPAIKACRLRPAEILRSE